VSLLWKNERGKVNYSVETKVVSILVGISTSIVGYFIIRTIRNNDNKMQKLFDICDEIKDNKIPKLQQRISAIEEAIRWLKEK
jgi:hypothetical protein